MSKLGWADLGIATLDTMRANAEMVSPSVVETSIITKTDKSTADIVSTARKDSKLGPIGSSYRRCRYWIWRSDHGDEDGNAVRSSRRSGSAHRRSGIPKIPKDVHVQLTECRFSKSDADISLAKLS